MLEFLAHLLDPAGFPPRWQCGVWSAGHGWLHVLSDLGVWSAYFAIPLVLAHFARRRADLPFRHLFWLFGAFILACGSTHLMEAVIFWWPAYRLAGALKLVTAVISWATVFALVPVVPRALALRSPEELEREVKARTEELAAERERFRTTLASIADAVIATDTAGRVTFLNPAAAEQTGWPAEAAVGRPLREVFRIVDEATRAEVESPAVRALREGTAVGLANHTVLLARDGRERPIDDSAAPIRRAGGGVDGAVLVFRDVSEQRRAERALRAAEDRLRQAAKLEAVGLLAGGVAHDFNNLLTVVNGCGELLRDGLPADSPGRPLADDILRAGERGAALTRQLLAFSRQQVLRVEVLDPNRLVRETAGLLARLLGEDVAVNLHLDPAAGPVRADAGQFTQVLVNLAVNARDAMPTGGTLTVSTAAVEVPADAPPPAADARPGRYARLTVTDTGAGMPPEVLARLFEPFFTTKEVGKGTGLGLATVYGVVTQCGGFVTVRSEVGKGSTFAVHLPVCEPTADDLPDPPRPAAAGRETVLLVEDDTAVRALAADVLRRHGYRVEAVADGAAALAALDRLPAPPELLLTDVVMPGMSGRELAEAAAARFPGLRVGFLSGYTADAVLRHGVEEQRVPFLQKPYTPDALARFARALLDRPAAGGHESS